MYYLTVLEVKRPKGAEIKVSADSKGESAFLLSPVSRCFPLPSGKLVESVLHRITLTLTAAFIFHI